MHEAKHCVVASLKLKLGGRDRREGCELGVASSRTVVPAASGELLCTRAEDRFVRLRESTHAREVMVGWV